MLDRCKLIKEVQAVSDKLFIDVSRERNIAQEVWNQISKDPTFKYKVRGVQTNWIIPEWKGNLNDVFQVNKELDKYIVLSVDGSQIYPDRHAGTACHLINVGYVALNYGLPGPRVYLNSEPHVFADFGKSDLLESPTELVNCRRQDFELISGHELSCAYQKKYSSMPEKAPEGKRNTDERMQKDKGEGSIPQVFLFDGSIIFWHLESKAIEVKEQFLASYLKMMHKFYENKLLMAGYISLTKSKEIVNLIRVALCNFVIEDCQEYTAVDRVVDAMVASFYLEPFERSTVFKNNSKITSYYPEHLQPHFFYMHIGSEIVRIEIPAWIADDTKKVDLIATMIADQSIKGMGYPVALAEAHEQAVVKGPDREFFYHLINKIGFEQKQTVKISQKSRKKLGMGI